MLVCKYCGGNTGKFEEEFGEMKHENLLTCVSNLTKQISHMEYKKVRCSYCGKERPYNELKQKEIYVNGEWVKKLFCADDGCDSYAQMSAEG